MKHTKGEWKVDELSSNVSAVISTDETIICTTVGETPHLLNAKRIVQCVNNFDDLLEACEDALIFIKLLNLDEEHHLNSMLTTAINKAKGVK